MLVLHMDIYMLWKVFNVEPFHDSVKNLSDRVCKSN